jgi:anti-sigma factor RsiW
MATPNDHCAARRAELRERSLDGLPPETAPAVLRAHLDGCPECRRYAEGLRQAPGLFRTAGLYTPELRRRALAATAAAPEPLGAGRLLLVLGAALTGFGASVVLPFWLLSRLLGTVCPTGICALAGAAAIFLLLGLGAGGAIAVPALTRDNSGKAIASWAIWR